MNSETNVQIMRFLKKRPIPVFIILAVALFLCLYRFRQGEVLVSSDEVFAFETSLKPVYGLFSGSLHVFVQELFRFFNYPWGWASLTGSALTTFVQVLFHLPITEFTMNMPHIIAGLFSIVSLYVFCQALTGKRLVAFFAAFIFAILPVHVALSRSVATNGVYSTSLFLLTMLFFIDYFRKIETEKNKAKKSLKYGMISLGFYLGADNQFLGILPVIFFAGVIFSKNKNILKRMLQVLRTFLSRYVLLFFVVSLPLILGAAYLLTKGLFRSSYLNLFHSKPLVVGMYYPDFFKALYDDVGPVLLGVLVISFLYNLACLFWKKEQRDTRLLVLLWFTITGIPWIFLLSSKIAWFQLYILEPMTCLVIYAALFLYDLFEGVRSLQKGSLRTMIKGTYFFVVLAIAFFTVLSTSNLIYKTTYFGWQFTPIFGQVGNNIGIKTMGYYVREHTPEESVVFVDVESFVGEYYVKRKIIGDLDLTDEQIYAQLSSLFNKDSEKGKNVGKNITQEKSPFDYAFIYKEHFATLGPVLERNGYYARVMAVDDHGETIAKLYGLKTKNNSWSPMPIVLSIKETDQLFNKKYGYLNNLYINYG